MTKLRASVAKASSAQAEQTNPLTEEFGEFARKTLKEFNVPGVSIVVIDGDNIFAEGYGFATLPDTPATPSTLWYAASTTKAFTAATLAHLIASGKYPRLAQGWSTPISSIIRDDFVLQDPWATAHLTLEDAVCHRTGFAGHDKAMAREEDGRQLTVRDAVRNLRNLPLADEPRVKWRYCNLMYVLLSHVIETVTGKALGSVMREVIWEPLGMEDTYFDLDDAKAAPEHLATGYYWDGEGEKFDEVPYLPVVEVSGAGGIISNALDFAKWLKCLIHESAPFSESTHKDIQTPRFICRPPAGGKDVALYGLGWIRSMYQGHVMYEHSGGMHAYGSQAWWFPEDKYAVVAFGNTCLTANAVAEVLGYTLIHQRFGITPSESLDPVKTWNAILGKYHSDYEKATENIYPNIPDPPLPSPLSVRELAGTYYDAGYKNITLRVEAHPRKAGEEVLVAVREDFTWQYEFRLEHISGTFWIMYVSMSTNPTQYLREYEKAEFRIGPDGKPAALEVGWWDRLEKTYVATTVFKRVD